MPGRSVAAAAVLAAGALAACSSGHAAPSPTHESTSTSQAITQWWSGSDYCTILRQTLDAGKSVVPNARAGDPQLVDVTKQFVAALTTSAPADLRTQWHVLGAGITHLVESAGKTSTETAAEGHRVAAAAKAISADARSRCSVNLGS